MVRTLAFRSVGHEFESRTGRKVTQEFEGGLKTQIIRISAHCILLTVPTSESKPVIEWGICEETRKYPIQS